MSNFCRMKISWYLNIFAKSPNLIPKNIKIFCQAQYLILRISKIFWPTAKFFLKIVNLKTSKFLWMVYLPIKYHNSLMKVKKLNKSRLNSLFLPWNQNGLLISKITWPHPKGNKLISGDWGAAGILFNICRPKMKRIPATRRGSLEMGIFLMLQPLREGVWRWKYFWCYSSGIVIFIDYLQLFLKYTSLNLILIFSISVISLYKIVLD